MFLPSPNEKLIARTDYDDWTVKFWDAKTLELLHEEQYEEEHNIKRLLLYSQR